MKTRKEKEKILKDLVEKFKKANGYLLVNLLGLHADSEKKLRTILKENNSLFEVVRKTLIYKANPQFPFSDEETKFPFGFIWNFDENLSSFRALKILEKEGVQVNIVCGYLDGKVLTKEEIKQLINLPPKEELQAKFVQILKSQFYYLHYSLTFPLKKLILLLSSIKDKKD
jgi:large subunit ribosomal protein L10